MSHHHWEIGQQESSRRLNLASYEACRCKLLGEKPVIDFFGGAISFHGDGGRNLEGEERRASFVLWPCVPIFLQLLGNSFLRPSHIRKLKSTQ